MKWMMAKTVLTSYPALSRKKMKKAQADSVVVIDTEKKKTTQQSRQGRKCHEIWI